MDHSILYFSNEILIHIIKNLTILDFQKLLQTCKFFIKFDHEYIWEILAKKEASDIYSYKHESKTYKWLCLAKVGSYYKYKDPITKKDLIMYGNFSYNFSYGGTGFIENGHGISIKRDRIISGYFKDGELEGYGCSWDNEKNKYIGEFVNGVQEGFGKMFWYDSDYYEGEWYNNHRNGNGIYKFSKSGSIYEGTFKMNEIDGKGTLTWKDGYYEGDWTRSKRHGHGEIIWNNGNRFIGNFISGERIGYGEYQWADGASYKGKWLHNNRHGKAITSWANNVSHEGCYVDDLRNGIGTLTWPNGDKYVGKWKNGGRKGQGTFISIDGIETKQVWNEKEKIQYSKEIPLKHH